MNKQELVAAMALESDLTKKDSETALNAIISIVGEALSNKEKVVLSGFGKFEVKERATKKGINPQNKEKIIIPAKLAPTFKFSPNVKYEVSEEI